MYLYVVHDIVAGESGPIFEAKNDEVAKRNVRNMLKNVDTVNYYDYQLLRVGFIDHEENILSTESNPEEIFIELVDNKKLEEKNG